MFIKHRCSFPFHTSEWAITLQQNSSQKTPISHILSRTTAAVVMRRGNPRRSPVHHRGGDICAFRPVAGRFRHAPDGSSLRLAGPHISGMNGQSARGCAPPSVSAGERRRPFLKDCAPYAGQPDGRHQVFIIRSTAMTVKDFWQLSRDRNVSASSSVRSSLLRKISVPQLFSSGFAARIWRKGEFTYRGCPRACRQLLTTY